MIHVRPYRAADLPQLRTLFGRIRAEWDRGSESHPVPRDLEHIEKCYVAFWVAVEPQGDAEEIVGMVGAALPDGDVPTELTRGRSGIVQLGRLRVSPECRRQGVGARLCRTLLDWAHDQEQDAVLANTVPENNATRVLMRKIGFAEAGVSVTDATELLWFDLPIGAAQDSKIGETVMSGYPQLLHTALDTTDARALAEFYRQLLGLQYRPGDERPPDGAVDDAGWLVLVDADGVRTLAFQQVDRLERTTWPDHDVPMQLHLDFTVPSFEELQRHRDRAESLGADVLLDRTEDTDEPLYVLADPSGHPFCILVT